MRRHREIAAAIIIDTSGRLLLQQRDNVPGILYPGKVGLFGGHREGNETFLECVVRELHEELSYSLSPERFEPLWSYEGPDWDKSGGTLHGEFFFVREIPINQVTVTEGALLVVDESAVFYDLGAKLAPSAARVLAVYASKRQLSFTSRHGGAPHKKYPPSFSSGEREGGQ